MLVFAILPVFWCQGSVLNNDILVYKFVTETAQNSALAGRDVTLLIANSVRSTPVLSTSC